MTASSPFQIPLSISWQDDATFDNFCPLGNEQVFSSLKDIAFNQGESLIYIWGKSGAGCTHLLQACCQTAQQTKQRILYVSFRQLLEEHSLFSSNLLPDIACLDHIDSIASDNQMEETVFHFFNKMRAAGNRLVIAGNLPPKQSGICLPDLHSRLSWGLIYQLHSPSDEVRHQALKLRAYSRGISLTDEAANYLLQRSNRDMHQLSFLLDTLDKAALSAKRRITVPFIKEVTGF